MGANPALVELIHQLSFKTGTFKLASGRTSNFYIDVRMTSTHPEGAALIGDEILRTAAALDPRPDAVGGMAVGALPIAIAACARSVDRGFALPSFFVRRESKRHGTGKRVEGHLRDGQNILIVDDTITTGQSTLDAIDAVLAEFPKCRVVLALAVVDREEGGREKIEKCGIPFGALVTRTDLFAREAAGQKS
ncbi:MAG: orotate phosphoribosyltransferase [Deltaproteobacteria bacterium]|nr:orotate phosphoribosyltransferase [Deltaproteobacteria bacterium]